MGAELARILMQHPAVEITLITSESHTGRKFSELHPQFQGLLDLRLASAKEVEAKNPDVVFLALPHGVSMEFVMKWADIEAKIIDLSGDFRLGDADIYKTWYKKEH